MANKQVIIEFKAEDKGLIDQLKKLDNVTKNLTGTQTKLQSEEKKVENSRLKQAQTLHKNFIAIQKLRMQVTKLGSNFNHARISTDVLTKALHGSKVAMDEVRLKTSMHIAEIKKYNESLKNVNVNQEGFTNSLRNTGTGTRILGGTFAVLRSKLLVFNFAMGLGIRQLSKFAGEAAKLEAMETAFNTLSGGGQLARNSIDKLTKATNGTVSNMDLFQQANNAMILGVTKNADEMANMFDIAQRLGDALGRDTRSSIESLITGIGRQSRMMLDNIGIIVKSDEAYENYAKELKKNVDDLTVLERKQAFLNATMEAAREKVSKLPPEVMTARHTFQQMSAEIDNVTARIGKHFTPAAQELAQAFTQIAKSIDVDALNKMSLALTTLATSFAVYKVAVFAATVALNGFAVSMGLATGGLSLLAGGLITAAMHSKGLFVTPTEEMQKLEEQALLLKEEIESLRIANLDTATATDILTEAQKKNKEALESNLEKVQSELTAMKLKRATLLGANKLDIIKLKLGKDFIKEQPKIIAMLEKEFEALSKLEKKKKQEKEADEKQQKNLKQKLKDKEKETNAEKRRLEKLASDRKKALDTIFQDDLAYQFQQLETQAEQFKSLKLGVEAEAQLEIWLSNKKLELVKNRNDKILALNKKHNDELNNARNVIYQDDLNFQLQQLELERNKIAKLLTNREDEIALEEWFQGQKRELSQKNLEENNLIYQATMSSYDAFVDSLLDKDATFLDAKKAINRAILESTIKFLAEMVKKQIEAFLIEHALQKAQNKKTEVEAMKNGAKIAASYGPAALAKTLAKGAPYVLAVAGAVAAFTAAQKFEKGGEVRGRRHSQGGTLIEAEQGEFVMSRNAVQSIGLENLAQMNATGNTGVTVNIQGNMIGNEEFVRDTLIPEINKTVNQGLA